jgi:hypothetical protein
MFLRFSRNPVPVVDSESESEDMQIEDNEEEAPTLDMSIYREMYQITNRFKNADF